MNILTSLTTAGISIVVAGITAYFTARIQSRNEQTRWERDLALRQAERQASEPETARAVARQFAVGYLIAPDRHKYYLMPATELVAGREEGADIHVDEVTVSYNHAIFRADARRVSVEDLNTNSGVYVNDEKIHTMTLKDKDKIRLGGSYVLEFCKLNRI